jgi:hypothetical protein
MVGQIAPKAVVVTNHLYLRGNELAWRHEFSLLMRKTTELREGWIFSQAALRYGNQL